MTVVGGTFLLHTTKDMDVTFSNLSNLTRSGHGATANKPSNGPASLSRRSSSGNGHWNGEGEEMQLLSRFEASERDTAI